VDQAEQPDARLIRLSEDNNWTFRPGFGGVVGERCGAFQLVFPPR
jgi:hypothetical protein